jgi:hypothetical protein
MFIVLFIFSTSIFGEDAWKTVEKVVVNGTVVTKSSITNNNIAKTINKTKFGSTETIINLKQNKIIIINNIAKTYQEINLAEYIKFAQNVAENMRAQGYIDPQTVLPKLEYKLLGTQKISNWNTQHYMVLVDNKNYMEIWVAKSLKDSPALKFRKKFASMMPESLVKYRSIQAKIKDHFAKTGMIVKSVKLPLNKKMPKVTQTITSISMIKLTPDMLKIPANYISKSSGATN